MKRNATLANGIIVGKVDEGLGGWVGTTFTITAERGCTLIVAIKSSNE